MNPRSILARTAPAVLVLSAAGCLPLPIAHRAQITPSVLGVIHHSDGTPVVGALVAAGVTEEDRSCAAATARDVTDAQGQFRLPAASERRRIFFLTMMENLGMTTYWLCAGGDAAPQPAGGAEPLRTHIRGLIAGDTLSCLRWEWRGEALIACNTPIARRTVSGGLWTDGSISGFYRVLLVDRDGRGNASRAFVQWIEPSAAGRVTVHATVELPAEGGVLPESEWGLSLGDTRWVVSVTSVRMTRWGNRRRLRFALGSPGEMTSLPES